MGGVIQFWWFLAGLFGLVVCCVKLCCLGWVPMFWVLSVPRFWVLVVLILMWCVFILFCVC